MLLQTAGGDSESKESQHTGSALRQWGEERRERVERDPEQQLQEGLRTEVPAAGHKQEQWAPRVSGL